MLAMSSSALQTRLTAITTNPPPNPDSKGWLRRYMSVLNESHVSGEGTVVSTVHIDLNLLRLVLAMQRCMLDTIFWAVDSQ